MTAPRHDLIGALPGIVAAQIGAILPELAECKGRRGRFDLDALVKEGVKAPSVQVALIELRQSTVYAGPYFTFSARMAAFVVTKDRTGLLRDDAAAAIVTALLRLIPDARWGLPQVHPAADVMAEAITTPQLEGKGVTLWAIAWSQAVALDTPAVPAPLPITLYLGQAPDIGPGNEGDYTQVGLAGQGGPG